MQYQLFLAVALAVVGCAVAAESEYEKALVAAIGEINEWDAKSMATLMHAMNKNKVTPESDEAEVTKGLVDYLFTGEVGAHYTEEINAGRKPTTAHDLVFVSELVVPCESVIKNISGPAEEIEKNGVQTTESRTDTWISISKFCQKFLDNANHWGNVAFKVAGEKNLV